MSDPSLRATARVLPLRQVRLHQTTAKRQRRVADARKDPCRSRLHRYAAPNIRQEGEHDQMTLSLAVKTSGNFVQQFVLLLPAGLERPGEDLLKMVAVVHSSMQKNNVGGFFRPA